MKRLTAILPLIMFCITLSAQQKFIKEIIDADYGAAISVLPAADLGWVVFSKDSLRLTKFNGCGDIEWSKKYHVANTHSSLSDFISTKDGGYPC